MGRDPCQTAVDDLCCRGVMWHRTRLASCPRVLWRRHIAHLHRAWPASAASRAEMRSTVPGGPDARHQRLIMRSHLDPVTIDLDAPQYAADDVALILPVRPNQPGADSLRGRGRGRATSAGRCSRRGRAGADRRSAGAATVAGCRARSASILTRARCRSRLALGRIVGVDGITNEDVE